MLPRCRATYKLSTEQLSVDEYPRELMDCSQLSIPPEFDTQPGLNNPVENQTDLQDDPPAEDTAEAQVVADAIEDDDPQQTDEVDAKKRWKRAKFAKMDLRARYTLYLNPSHLETLKEDFPDSYETIEIKGTIKECPQGPRKKFPCPVMVRKYQKGIRSIDRHDQMRMVHGSDHHCP
jgi:hypothetical protein